MKRVAIVGCCGTGKTTFSRLLAKKTNLPLIHLDRIYWHPGWVRTPADEWVKIQQREVEKDKWIIEGNYINSLSIRFNRADTIIFLDYPRWIAIYRSFKRRIQFHGKQRAELGPGNVERLTWAYLRFVLTYPRERMLEIISKYSDKHIVILKNPQDAQRLLQRE